MKDEKCEGRRRFLKQGAIAGALASVGPAALAADSFSPGYGHSRVEVISRANATSASPTAPDVPEFEFSEATFADLQLAIRSGKVTVHSLTEKYLQRIADIDKSGPAINAVIELNPDALEIAAAKDKERAAANGNLPPLHGLPILIKDNIDTADKMMTTAGSLALVGAKPPKDSFVAQKLREAGAVIIGKTNLSEWANIRSSHSTSGWSGRGGLTKNPYALDRNPCGSSSGSGAGTSAGICAGAIGTETDGSIVCPSSSNGVVGIKPTVGLVSRAGIVPISHTQDGAGPMCRTVTDAAILLGALTGVDPDDHATAASAGKSFTDYTRYLDPKGLRGARIGVVRKYFGFSDAVDAVMESALDAMKKQGAILVDPAEIATFGKGGNLEFTIFLYELKADLHAYFARLGPDAPVKSLQDVIEFNERNHSREMQYFGQDTFLKSQAKGPLTSPEYVDAIKDLQQIARVDGIDATMNKLNLDALVAPAGGPAWVTDLVNGDNSAGGSSNAAAQAGYPNISVPAGYVFGLPVGISFFGRAWSEPTLIKLAYAFEQTTKARRAPKFLPTADLTA